MTVKTPIQLAAAAVPRVARSSPPFRAKVLEEGRDINQFNDMEICVAADVTGRLNPFDSYDDELSHLDYTSELRVALWKAVYKKLGVTEEIVNSVKS